MSRPESANDGGDGFDGSDAPDLEWLSLEDGESVVWADGPDERTLVPALLIGIPLSLVLVGVFVIVGSWLQVTNTDYVVTTRALYTKTGTLSRDVQQRISERITVIGNSISLFSLERATRAFQA